MAEYKPVSGWAYLFGGIAIGTVLGVLFAKKPGKETREELFDWLKEKREEGREMASKWRDRSPFKRDHEVDHKKEFIHA